MSDEVIGKHGGYRNLITFQIARLVYDITVRFCDRYIDIRSRTHDQMVQAARSGVQNIAEGSEASGTSKKMEIKLTNVAKASLEELKLDYEDFLRQRRLCQWSKDDGRRQELIDRRCTSVEQYAAWVRELHNRSEEPRLVSTGSTQSTKSTYSGIAANGAIVLIQVVTPMLDRQIRAQLAEFGDEGGFTENLYHYRKKSRDEDDRDEDE